MQSSVTRSRTSITKSLPASFKLSIFNLSSESYIKVLGFVKINILFSFWQIRFFLKFSRIDVLFTSSSVQLIDFHYTDKWVSKNIDEEGHLIEWLKLGYRPL